MFSYLEEEKAKETESTPLSSSIEELDIPVQDFVFPDDLEDFYPTTNREKIETNIAAIELVKRLEKEGRQANPEEQELLASMSAGVVLPMSFSMNSIQSMKQNV